MNSESITVTHAAILALQSRLDRTAISQAWEKTKMKNPFLHVKWSAGFIKNLPVDQSKPEFVSCAEAEFADYFNASANIKVDSSRLMIYEAGLTIQIIVVTPHSLADGTSMMLILYDLLTFYEKPFLSQTLITEYPVAAQHLGPNLDPKMVQAFKEKTVRDAKAFKNVVPRVQFEKARPKKSPTKVTIGKGTPEASEKLLAFCRKHGITIGTYLTAAFAFINSKIMKEHCKELQFGLDYNLRDRFPRKLGNTTVATYISENTHRPNAELHESIVQVAARMKADINRGIQNQEPFMLKALIDLYIKDEKMFRPPEQNHCNSSVNFSNVGKYKFDTKYDFGEIQEMYCSGYNWCHYEYTFLFQTTDKLCITITNMDMDLYNNSAQLYLDGFLELTENPEKYEFETLKSFANL